MAWCPLLLCSPDERHSKLRRIFTDLVLPPARYLVNSCCSRQQTLWIKPTCLHATASQILGQLTSSLPIFALAKCQKVVIARKQEFSVTCPVLLYPDTLLWQLMLLGGLGLSTNIFVTHPVSSFPPKSFVNSNFDQDQEKSSKVWWGWCWLSEWWPFSVQDTGVWKDGIGSSIKFQRQLGATI